MKSAVFVVLFSTLVILEVSCQERCYLPRRPCGDNQCCVLLPLLGGRCRDLGKKGERCGLRFNRCECEEGLTCVIPSFICEDRRPTTTEEPDTTTTEGSTTTTEETTTT